MTVKLTNTQRTQQTFNLTREFAPKRHLFKSSTLNKDGSVSFSDRRVVIPDSVTLLAGESREFVDGILTCPEIKNAIASKKLRVEVMSAEAVAQEDEAVEVDDEQLETNGG